MLVKIRDLRNVVEDAGLTFLGCETTGGSHRRLNLRLPDGKEMFYVTGSSPSDHRSRVTLRADLRRLARTGRVR